MSSNCILYFLCYSTLLTLMLPGAYGKEDNEIAACGMKCLGGIKDEYDKAVAKLKDPTNEEQSKLRCSITDDAIKCAQKCGLTPEQVKEAKIQAKYSDLCKEEKEKPKSVDTGDDEQKPEETGTAESTGTPTSMASDYMAIPLLIIAGIVMNWAVENNGVAN